MKLLVVDDDVIILQAMKSFLSKEGFEVISTADAQEALKIIEEQKNELDLVVSDIMMPFMSGIELLTAIKEINKDIPIVIVSALDQREVIMMSFQLGAEDFVKKPINMDELIIRVQKALKLFEQPPVE